MTCPFQIKLRGKTSLILTVVFCRVADYLDVSQAPSLTPFMPFCSRPISKHKEQKQFDKLKVRKFFVHFLQASQLLQNIFHQVDKIGKNWSKLPMGTGSEVFVWYLLNLQISSAWCFQCTILSKSCMLSSFFKVICW